MIGRYTTHAEPGRKFVINVSIYSVLLGVTENESRLLDSGLMLKAVMIVAFLLFFTLFHNIYLLHKCHTLCLVPIKHTVFFSTTVSKNTECTLNRNHRVDKLCDTCQEEFPRILEKVKNKKIIKNHIVLKLIK